jgi:hypothetical protein
VDSWLRKVSQEVWMPCSRKARSIQLNTDQQVVGQHTQKDVGFNPALQMMKDGSFAKGTFHRAESSLNAAQQDVGAPNM